VIALPGTIVGAWLGRSLYGRLDTRRFGRIVLVVLLLGGLGIVGASLRALA
jgi:uncharacterized membrane protein YfcA